VMGFFRSCRVLPVALVGIATAIACGSGGDDGGDVGDGARVDAGIDVPAFRNQVDLSDDELGAQVVAFLGGAVPDAATTCSECHGVTRQQLRWWRALGDKSMSECLTDLEVTEPAAARAMIDCLRADPTDPLSAFDSEKVGIYATSAHLPWFAYLFGRAYGEDEGPAKHAELVERIGMPLGNPDAIDQSTFDLIAEYFTRGLPALDAVLPEDPAPTVCTQGVSADVTAHVAEMARSGWRAVNAENGILMHGCGAGGSPRDCLSDTPRAPEWESLAGAVVRRLRAVDHKSAYWTRSSADGRFVGHGLAVISSMGAAIVDLQADRVIRVRAQYDPGFFPDNDGFVFQPPAIFCEQAVLTASPSQVNLTEPGCSEGAGIDLYQHVGASLGGDYWAVDSLFETDDGGHETTLGDPRTPFPSRAETFLTPMVHQGNSYTAGDRVALATPFEGDSTLSPSARLLMARVAGPNDTQLGFVLRQIDATPTPAGYEVEATEVGRYCVNGGKPGFSYDERWVAYHHYVEADDAVELGFTSPDDPAFTPYLAEGSSNIYILDLLNGETRRVTGMAPGEYALFPHFRSDGWIYFVVRSRGDSEVIAATDAALVLED